MDRIIELIIYCQGREFKEIREFPSDCSIEIKTMAGASISITEGCNFGDPVTYEIKHTDIQPDKVV